jgi:serine/threonine-protein kinase ATR
MSTASIASTDTKGKSFEIPERVPFRLTHNMVDALGVTGVEGLSGSRVALTAGVYRKAAEICLGVLRVNTESLMSVLEAFMHDPLVEWTKVSRSAFLNV